MVVSGMQQDFTFEFTYLLSSPHITYLTRGLQTWPWEGCRGNWLPAWGLYSISKECTAVAAFPVGAATHIATGAIPLSLQAQGLPFFMQECCTLQLVLRMEKSMFGYHYQNKSLPVFCLSLCQ